MISSTRDRLPSLAAEMPVGSSRQAFFEGSLGQSLLQLVEQPILTKADWASAPANS